MLDPSSEFRFCSFCLSRYNLFCSSIVALMGGLINVCQPETTKRKTHGNGFSCIGTQHTNAKTLNATWHMNTALSASAYDVMAATL